MRLCDLSVGEIIGEGAFSIVKKAYYQNQPYALKIIQLDDLNVNEL